ncbi:macro domain-containing protein [Thermosediminibacter litoriperuensis]|uniref:O-acetyl-ADP-ribose deacetylase (Regulator of RNase III) n=1 Tax=Thermosediminibacter litoriperuensis TaxID=291989 RepID=A0A5S5AW22_9FIRM|nr:macro domain-containing protein [Thermosediminibacter litoriperuensis]TYP56727.1 O-acetyl-ADP-ribose deacetylase (regulator of RNase III) [Thermosediminibacter litoriperuensis]
MKVVIGDITKAEADVIVNAANGLGPMGGGVALAIKKAGGKVIEDEAVRVCREMDPQPGDVYVTTAGGLKAKYVFHAVTMKKPAEPSSVEIVRKCLQSLLEKARQMGVKSMVLPALATGVGGVPKKDVARVYREILGGVKDIYITVMDISGDFIKYLEG